MSACCPICRTSLDWLTAGEDGAAGVLKDGDLTVCICCTAILVAREDLGGVASWVETTAEEVFSMPGGATSLSFILRWREQLRINRRLAMT